MKPHDKKWHGVFTIDRFAVLQEEYIASILEHAKDIEGLDHDKRLRAIDVAIKMIDALYIAEYLRQREPKKILEVGSFMGFSARWILEITQAWRAHLTLIDPHVQNRLVGDGHAHIRKFCKAHLDRLHIINGFLSGLKEWHYTGGDIPIITEPFDQFDCIFIDGDHTLEITLRNMILAARMMNAGGQILVHDAITIHDAFLAVERFQTISPEIRLITDLRYFWEGTGRTKYGPTPPPDHLKRSPEKLEAYRQSRIKSGLAELLFEEPETEIYVESFRSTRINLCNGVAILEVPQGIDFDRVDVEALLQAP